MGKKWLLKKRLHCFDLLLLDARLSLSTFLESAKAFIHFTWWKTTAPFEKLPAEKTNGNIVNDKQNSSWKILKPRNWAINRYSYIDIPLLKKTTIEPHTPPTTKNLHHTIHNQPTKQEEEEEEKAKNVRPILNRLPSRIPPRQKFPHRTPRYDPNLHLHRPPRTHGPNLPPPLPQTPPHLPRNSHPLRQEFLQQRIHLPRQPLHVLHPAVFHFLGFHRCEACGVFETSDF